MGLALMPGVLCRFAEYQGCVQIIMHKKNQVAHFVHDNQFIDSAYYQFEEVLPGRNVFYITTKRERIKHIKETPVVHISKFSFKNPFFIRQLNQFSFIVLHALSNFNRELVAHAEMNTKFVWIGMGYDYYDLIFKNKEDKYLCKTLEIINKLSEHGRKKSMAFHFIKSPLRRIIYKNFPKTKILHRISYFSPVLPIEHSIIESQMNAPIPKYIHWNYGLNAKLVLDLDDTQTFSGNSILLGNSSSPNNNHLEAIDLLKQIGNNSRKIICPLSYGLYTNYADYIESYGSACLGEAFIGIREYLPHDEYFTLISECSNVIMNHLRQEGVGVISAMLLKGAKVFLNHKNPIYLHFKDLGVRVFSIDDLRKDPSLLDRRLSACDIEKNRKILKDYLCWETAVNKTRNLITCVMNSATTNPGNNRP